MERPKNSIILWVGLCQRSISFVSTNISFAKAKQVLWNNPRIKEVKKMLHIDNQWGKASIGGTCIMQWFLIGPILWWNISVATPLWAKCEDETHTPKSGNLESFGTLATSELDRRGQNTSSWGVFCTVGKVLKCRCPKWPRMSHLNVCSPSYGQKKGRESNWQFDSRPLKVRNRPNSDVCRRSATWRWKDLKESYKIASELIPIGGLNKKLWMPKVPGV